MKLYFENATTIASTILIFAILVYIAYTCIKRKEIMHWGRRILLLAVVGLVTCCFVAARDGYHLSVQASFDNTIAAGLFALNSIQSTLCCIGGGIIAFSAISSIFVKKQKYRKAMFFLLSSTVIVKILTIEISRWMV